MAIRKPLVLISGDISQLPPGDFISGDTVNAIPGSGLVGGGTDVNEFRFDVALTTASSGLIFVGDKLGIDGSAQASGNAGIAQALAGVTRIIPGSGLFISPAGGSGIVTIHASGGGGGSVTATAGSGLVGGGINTTDFRFDLALAAAPSGLIFVSNKLGLDGSAQASGNAAIVLGINALASGNLAIASGNAAQVTANNALTSGNLAIASGNAGIAQGLAGVRTLAGGSGMFVTPVGGSGFVTVHSSGVSPTAGSGLVGGGTNVFDFRLDVALAAAPSGLIFVSNKLGLDGSAQASGNAAIVLGINALASGNLAIASGNAAQVTANNALTSGNLAIASGNAAISLGLNALASGNLGIASGNAAQVTANNALTSGNLAIASGNAAIVLGINALASGNLAIASGNAGIAQALAGVTRLVAGNNITLSPTGGSGVVTITSAGSAVGSGVEKVFFENQTVISGSYTITSGFNAGSFGPVTLVSGVVITVPSGSVWTVV